MSTTLSRSLALLISMFALTSSFSLSMNLVESEDAWIVEMVESKDTGSSTKYFVKKGMPLLQEKEEPSERYKEVIEYQNIKKFRKTLDETLDSTFVLYKLNSKNVIVGFISNNYGDAGYKLHLFWASKSNQTSCLKPKCVLNKTEDTFFVKKKMKETEDGYLKLHFNGEEKQTIEVKARLGKYKIIDPHIIYLDVEDPHDSNDSDKKAANSNNTSWNKNYYILFWSSIFIAFAFTAIYVIYKYWWLPRKRSL